jgi:ABC-type bacteriocin/lantibiotic exporter with double-glycine peptidase domain
MIFIDLQKTADLLANTLKNIEELIYQGDKSVVLPNFPRTIQLSGWTCGARCVYSILRSKGRRCTVESVERELRTDWEGTDVTDVRKVFLKHRLKFIEKKHCRLPDVRKAIDDGNPVLISVNQGSHYSVVFGYSNAHIYVMNPAVFGGSGSIFCRVPRKDFADFWDHWCIIVCD